MSENEKPAKPERSNSESDELLQILPNEVQSAVNKITDKKPGMLSEFMALGMGSIGNPLHQKMTTEHISQVLDIAAKHDERQYDLSKRTQEIDFSKHKSNYRYLFAAFVIITILTIFILILFKDKPDILIPTLTGLGGLLGGFIGGWGLGKKNE